MERMTGLDAGFYFAESETTPLHIASVSVFEGPPPTYGDLIRAIVARLPDVPRYRQRVRPLPLNLGKPVWVDDPHFNILYHVRHTAVPRPGSPEQLRNLAGRVLSQRLDPSKPLWEIWLVEGLEDDQWAVICKVHHCVVDGVGGIDLMTTLFDLEPDAERQVPRELPAPEPGPSAARIVASTLTTPLRELPGVARSLTRIGGLSGTLSRLSRPAATTLNGPLGPHRRWMWTHAEMDEIKRIRTALGGTVNDVVLAAVTHGFREVLDRRGELTDEEQVVRALVPISVRTKDQKGELANRVSGVLINLPVGEPDATRRLLGVRSQMDTVKRTGEATGGQALARLAGFAPTLLAMGSRAALGGSQGVLQTVVTNVPGPPFPLYVLGRRLVRLYPFVPLALGMRAEVAVFSYLGRFTFGLTGDFDGMPDLAVLADGIRAGFTELGKAADA
jgi:diacylglycerol O-acyltransferase / wax synthase